MAQVVTKICKGRGQPFANGRDKNGRINPKKCYCSQQCWLKHWNTKGAPHALKGAAHGSKVNGDRTRGTGTRGYVKEDGRHQHLVVVERLLGRPLASGEVVHHEDRNKKNNSPDNLWVFPSQSEHARHHFLGHTEGRNLPCSCSTIRKPM
jgi:hypothetical protein